MKEQLQGLTSMNYSFEEIKTESMAGKEFVVLNANISYMGIEMSQSYYIRELEDGSFLTIVVTDTRNTLDIPSMFKAY